MGWWLILVCIVLGIIGYNLSEHSYKYDGVGDVMFGMSFAIGILLFIFNFGSWSILTSKDYRIEDEPVVVSTQSLYALKDNTQQESVGSGFIFFWGYSSKDKYMYRYMADGDIGKKV